MTMPFYRYGKEKERCRAGIFPRRGILRAPRFFGWMQGRPTGRPGTLP
ncbi:hypothetical protein SUBVAR_07425 [Subdoligranulum variabile DSM 15176]|uniref:Uncharacterized protein n=1 Tax=Subdoligranulum variabile DSM 15176 TaxID=411471 RepID=D1PSP1_9FIRM|nr:hypothetical protein SUBVAR_07425 [Subdoligranulum variabile DSM 15176]